MNAPSVVGLLVMALFAGASCDRNEPAVRAPPAVSGDVPVLGGDPWRVAGNPDLGALSDPSQQPVDFAVWAAGDGRFQLVSCIRNTAEAGEHRLLYRWEGDAVDRPDWEPRGVFMRADPALGETVGGLQAPYVTRFGAGFRMLFGDWEHIAVAASDDGKTFTRLLDASSRDAVFDEGAGANTRDPMVLEVGGVKHVFYTAHPGGHGAVYARTTEDFRSFSPSVLIARGGDAGTGPYSAESPHVIAHDGSFYLFRTQRYGADAETRVYRSSTLDDFGVDDDAKLVARLPIAAPEYLRTDAGEFLFYLRGDLAGIQAVRLGWQRGP